MSLTGNSLYKPGLKRSLWPTIQSWFHVKSFAVVATSALLILFGSAARGEIFLFILMLWKNWNEFKFFPKLFVLELDEASSVRSALDSSSSTINKSENYLVSSNETHQPMNAIDEFLKDYCLQHFYFYVFSGLLASYFLFFSVGGFLQWQYYIKRRDRPEEWKCQPSKFLTSKNERHEVLLGSACLLVAGTISGLVSTYIANGGTMSRVYFNIDDRGWLYFFASTVVLFLLQDAASYYFHRMLHLPIFYRNFHKWHHGYHCPTAFSAVAMHPLESTVFQIILLAPLFIVPLHFISVIGCFHYLYYFGLVDHSGIDLDSIWPWQPPVRFHDDHHKYFHVNFGFNTMVFDKLHGTLRRKDRRYGEDVFYGKGAPSKTE